jgi:hypothetical protein
MAVCCCLLLPLPQDNVSIPINAKLSAICPPFLILQLQHLQLPVFLRALWFQMPRWHNNPKVSWTLHISNIRVVVVINYCTSKKRTLNFQNSTKIKVHQASASPIPIYYFFIIYFTISILLVFQMAICKRFHNKNSVQISCFSQSR